MNVNSLNERIAAARSISPGTRLLVGGGTCGEAVGSGAMLAKLQGMSSDVVIQETGCNGLCWLNPQVTLSRPGQPQLTWGNITEEEAEVLIEVASGVCPPSTAPRGFSWEPGGSDGLPGLETQPFLESQERRLLADAGRGDPTDLDEALLRGRYQGLIAAMAMPSTQLIDLVTEAGVRGRGGAYFPTGIKFRGCVEANEQPRYLVVNAEEGEPGVYKDRHLLESDPHLVLEGILIAACAIEAETAYLFVNGMATHAANRLAEAIKVASEAGLVGRNILGTDFSCNLEFRFGGGGYVLGEESAMLEAIEGRKPVPRCRPPFPVTDGLWGRPTSINNVETLANLPLAITHGVEGYRSVGTEEVPGTKLVCVSGDVQRAGLVEIEIGTTLRTVVESMAGGPADGHDVMAVLTGGPSGTLVSPGMLDTTLEPGHHDVLLGSGNVVVLDDRRSIAQVVQQLAAFNAEESCGKCTPCREGSQRMVEILHRAATGESHTTDRQDLLYLCDIATHASICGLGQMASNPVHSGIVHFALAGIDDMEGGVD